MIYLRGSCDWFWAFFLWMQTQNSDKKNHIWLEYIFLILGKFTFKREIKSKIKEITTEYVSSDSNFCVHFKANKLTHWLTIVREDSQRFSFTSLKGCPLHIHTNTSHALMFVVVCSRNVPIYAIFQSCSFDCMLKKKIPC